MENSYLVLEPGLARLDGPGEFVRAEDPKFVRLLAVLDHKPLSKIPKFSLNAPPENIQPKKLSRKDPYCGALDIAASLAINITN